MPTPTPTISAPPPPAATGALTSISQDVFFTHLSENQWVGDLKVVYQAGYAISIKVFDEATFKYKAGVEMSSAASTKLRRAGIKVVFLTKIPPDYSGEAMTAAVNLAKYPYILVQNIRVAYLSSRNSGNVTAVILMPSDGQVTVAAPTITANDYNLPEAITSTNSSSRTSSSILLILLVIFGIVLVASAFGCYFCWSAPLFQQRYRFREDAWAKDGDMFGIRMQDIQLHRGAPDLSPAGSRRTELALV